MLTETPAVTTPESAPGTEEVSLQERLNNATEDEYKTWERTGEIPAIKPKAEEPPAKPETPAASKESSAAEPEKETVETAPVAEPGKPQKKRNGDARILQLLEERKQEREEFNRRMEELERRLAKPVDASVKPEAQPAADAKADQEPTIDGINPKTGKQFQTIAEWQKEHTAWLRTQITSEFRGELTKSEQQRIQSERERAENEGLASKLVVGKDKYADFEKVAFNPDLPLPKGSPADIFIRQSESPADLLYYLGQHPEVLQGFYRYVPGKDDQPGKLTGVFEQLISPNLQMMKLAQIEAHLAMPATEPKVVPPAPKKPLPHPPTVLAANSSASGDAVEDALKKKSFADYEKAANASERKVRRA